MDVQSRKLIGVFSVIIEITVQIVGWDGGWEAGFLTALKNWGSFLLCWNSRAIVWNSRVKYEHYWNQRQNFEFTQVHPFNMHTCEGKKKRKEYSRFLNKQKNQLSSLPSLFPSFTEWMPKLYTGQLYQTISGACWHLRPWKTKSKPCVTLTH